MQLKATAHLLICKPLRCVHSCQLQASASSRHSVTAIKKQSGPAKEIHREQLKAFSNRRPADGGGW